MKNPKQKHRCVICRDYIKMDVNGWNGGHNAEPVSAGRCCEFCNSTAVIPARMNRLFPLYQREMM